MSEDRTIPMKQPQWSRGETEPNEQETVYTEQKKDTPPALPLRDQGGWQSSTVPEAPHPDATTDATPRPQPAPSPFGAPSPEPQTMLVGERPSPVFAWLVVVDGPDRNSIGTIHTLHPENTTIGRVLGNQIVLRDETVSAQHARIRHETTEVQESVHTLFDMGSSNGCQVGSRDTYRNEENRVYRHELKDGDYLLLGETTLVFKKV
jgi:pSer/pThr/pTyr-binding forkhead associated (FHA) protein